MRRKLPVKSLGGVLKTGAGVASLIPGGQLIGGALGVAGSIADMAEAESAKASVEKELKRNQAIQTMNQPVIGKNLSKTLPMYPEGGSVPSDIKHNGKVYKTKETMTQDGKEITYKYDLNSLVTPSQSSSPAPTTYPTSQDIENSLTAKSLGLPAPKLARNRTMPLNPDELKAAEYAGIKLAHGGKVKGGYIKPVSKHLSKAEGETHEGPNEGIDLKNNLVEGKTIAKVENQETILKEGGKPDFVFSDRIKIGNKTFAEASEEIADDKTSLKKLANTQEYVKGKLPVYKMRLGGPPQPDKKVSNILESFDEESYDLSTETLDNNPKMSVMFKNTGYNQNIKPAENVQTNLLRRDVRLMGKGSNQTTDGKSVLDNYLKTEFGKASKFDKVDIAQVAAPVAATALFRSIMPNAPRAVTNKGYGAARGIMPTKFSLDANRQDVKQSELNANQVISQNTNNSSTLRSNVLGNRLQSTKAFNEINQAERQGQNQLDAARATLEVQAGADEQATTNANTNAKFMRDSMMASETVKGISSAFENFALTKKDKEQKKMDLLGLALGTKAAAGNTGVEDRLFKSATEMLGQKLNVEKRAYGGKLKSKKMKSC